MLSSDAFTGGMAILMDRYTKVFQPPTLAAYYQLVRELSDDEFTHAVTLCIKRHAFFPSGDELLDAARPPLDTKLHAEELWNDVLSSIRRRPWRMIERAAFSDGEWKVIAAVGGLEAIANMTHEAEPHVHRRFVEAYAERVIATEDGHTLTGADRDARVAQLVTDVAKRIGVAKEP